jgi:hypothetical protein
VRPGRRSVSPGSRGAVAGGGLGLALLACAALSSQPHFSGEPTPEGLRRVENTRLAAVYLKPGADLGSYDAILLEEPEIAFKRPPRRSRGEFPLSADQQQELRSLFLQAFREEIEKGGVLQLVDAPSPAALRLEPAIVDLVVTAAPEGAGRDHVLIEQTAQLTLVAELRDAESGELLARVADRRVARRGAGGAYVSTPLNNRAALLQVFRRWAGLLAQGLERARELQVDTQE